MTGKALKSLLALAAGAAIAFAATAQAGLEDGKLVVAADVGFAPHVMAKPGGGYEGYNVDMMDEIARRLGVEYEIVDQQWSGIFAGLNAGKYDFIIAPTTVTDERAQNLLFMEGYLDQNYQFLKKKGASEYETLEDLEGKTIAVNRGNLYDKWVTANAEKYDWEVQRYGKNADAIQAVVTGRADLNIAGQTAIGWTASKSPMLELSVVVPTGDVMSTPFRKGDTELRNEVEAVVECMKKDGFFNMLSEKWMGQPLPEDAAGYVVQPGYGQPGFEGHAPIEHELNCE